MAAKDMTSREQWVVPPDRSFDLAAVDTARTDGAPGDKDETKTAALDLQERLAELQKRLYAEGERSLLVVVQGLDASGKDGAIRHLLSGINPHGARVTSFKVPSEEELSHDFLWRVHRAVPARSQIGVFNRSHYEDVLIVRVHGLVAEDVWRPRYDAINDFERGLVAASTTIVKFWLHLSADEQRERFQARLEDPHKRWKFRAADLDERKRWADYQAAATEMLERTSTSAAPWFVIPADRKWYRNWVVSWVVVATLEAMDPQYPSPDVDPEQPIPDA